MHDWVFYLAVSWVTVLIGALAWHAARVRRLVDRALAIDLLSLLLLAQVVLLAVQRQRAGYLDLGLILALLSFAQTMATARYGAEGRISS